MTCQILGLLVNTLAADDKYTVLNRENLTIPIQMQLYQRLKTFSRFFSAFLKSRLNFERFEKKVTLIDFVFSKSRTPKTWLDKYLKNPVSVNLSTSNMVNGPKHCWNLHHRTFIIFIDQCRGNWVRECLSYWYVKSWYCLVRHWLSLTSILVLTGKINGTN